MKFKQQPAEAAHQALKACNHPDWRIVIISNRSTDYVLCEIGRDTLLWFPRGSSYMWVEHACITPKNIASFLQACKRYKQAKAQFDIDLLNHWVEKNKY